PNQGMDVINTRMSSNDRPDIFLLDSPADVHQYAGDNLLLDMTPYVADYNWDSTMFDWAYDLAKVDDKVVTLPYGYEGMVLWYNKKIMAELGLKAENIKTLEAYEDALEKAEAAGYIPLMLGSQDWPWAQEWYLSIMFSYTGRTLLKNVIEGKDAAGWENPAFRKTVELYKSWHDRGYLADGKSFVLTSDDAINAFTSDKALFKLEGTWAPYWITPLEKEDQEKIGVMLHPAIGTAVAPHMPLAVGGMWCASADTDMPEVVSALISGLLGQDFQGTFLENGMDVAPMPIESSQFDNLMPNVKQMWSLVNGALADGSFGYTTWAFYPPETRVYLYEGIVNVLEDNISVDDYLAEMQRLNKKELEQGFKPVLPEAK
ncbi:MAG: carbohydrate ABC transporter substrate-binding protein, partial [Spirochaetales bacterium]|nr:carbohydrate ABC transporter substrate-binding protein [Spirochaetales bacterium]